LLMARLAWFTVSGQVRKRGGRPLMWSWIELGTNLGKMYFMLEFQYWAVHFCKCANGSGCESHPVTSCPLLTHPVVVKTFGAAGVLNKVEHTIRSQCIYLMCMLLFISNWCVSDTTMLLRGLEWYDRAPPGAMKPTLWAGGLVAMHCPRLQRQHRCVESKLAIIESVCEIELSKNPIYTNEAGSSSLVLVTYTWAQSGSEI
jgi:hypothetical protein